MAFMKISSPHATRSGNTGDVMKQVILACLPGLLALSYFFGPGSLMNVMLASATAVACEAAILKLRNRPIGFYLQDYSAVVTGVLLGLALPPYCPWWVVVVGTASAIILAKHLYGGMGYNPFNPAMVGYVILLISFPVEMTQWAAPLPALEEGQSLMSFSGALQQIWLGIPIDGYTGATPLDLFKQNDTLLVNDFYQAESLFATGHFAGAGWEWVNIGFLLGGLYLLWRNIFTWHAPISMLATMFVLSALFYDGGSSNSAGSPLLHLFSGATMLGAFFIATDPVSSAVSTKGRLIYGAGIGALVFLIRAWGNYPDAIAFAVLLMNFAAPFIDYYTLPRTYGHSNSRRATEKSE
ncbi:MAG: electron transport complex subunit RsxD [Cellvibrionaceae bacterium]|nr:electron transport complex subunit RsxD [Cellvibrionaceae bacterium]|tara:strand:+ start:21460 stop:22518 length:1059 start_codon:yes stop_codon:yes gene_type:complete